jgi:hypothetical protein
VAALGATRVSNSSIAVVYKVQGKYAQAEAHYAKVLEGCRHAFGPEHPYTTSTLWGLAWVRLRLRHYAEAESVLREGLTFHERVNSDRWIRYLFQSMLDASLRISTWKVTISLLR